MNAQLFIQHIVRLLLLVSILSAGLGVRPVSAQGALPLADAGADIIAEPGDLVQLDGSNSTGTGLSFAWVQIEGTPVTIFDATTGTPSFIFPFNNVGMHITLRFELTVTDDFGSTSTDQVLVAERQFLPPPALSTVPIPEPDNLSNFVSSRQAAIQLGKALFWDMQVGSDGETACASCHYHAGTDVRVRNQVNPGSNGVFDLGGPDYLLQASDFPLLKVIDDVIGTQGVVRRNYTGLLPGPVDDGVDVPDPVFHGLDGSNTRQVTARTAPSVINSVYNVRNFWDGRANYIFNGVNSAGSRDQNARIWQVQNGTPVQVKVALELSSLASQAVTPANSSIEMAWDGRTFPDLGKKMLSRTPLAGQWVHPDDSVLGLLANSRADSAANGLSTTYTQLVQQAFHPQYWSSDAVITIENGVQTVGPATGQPLSDDQYTLMQANFSLFFGLSIQMYEATLVSDDSPYDRYMSGDPTAITDQQKQGLEVFLGTGGCVLCHNGPEFTNAAITVLLEPDPAEGPGPLEVVERMAMANGTLAVYDIGFYNIGVRPTTDDLGLGGFDPLLPPALAPFSFSRMAQNGVIIGPPAVPNPIVSPSERIAVDGAFKVPSLRNIELTAPYMHNGGFATLQQVTDFYLRGGDFAAENILNLDPVIQPLTNVTEQDMLNVISFLKSLTDERVRLQEAPFDHPQLIIPNGTGETIEIAATGASGGLPLPAFIDTHPQVDADLTASKTIVRAGTPVTFNLALENKGDVHLKNVSVTPNLAGCAVGQPGGNQWASGLFEMTETWTFSCAAPLQNDQLVKFDVTAVDPTGKAWTGTATQSVDVIAPSISGHVQADHTTATIGDSITYTFTIENTGDSPLTNLSANDTLFGPLSLEVTTLAPGAKIVLQRTHVVSEANLPSPLSSTLTVTGLPSDNIAVTHTATALVSVSGSPSLQILLDTVETQAQVASVIRYTYRIHNTGNITLNNLSLQTGLSEPLMVSTTSLPPGATISGSFDLTVPANNFPGSMVISLTATGVWTDGKSAITTAQHSLQVVQPIYLPLINQ